MRKNKFISHVMSYGTGVAITRVLGLIREIIYAQYFGAGMLMDVFRVAFNLPNFLRDLFSEGSLSASFIPVCADKFKQEGEKEAADFTSQVLNNILIAITLITALLILIAPILVRIFVPGFLKNPYQFALTVTTMRIIFPFLIFITMSSIIMGFLNINKDFSITGISPSLWNLSIITAVMLLTPMFKRYSLPIIYSGAIGVVIGGFFQFAFQVPFAYRHKFRFSTHVNFKDPNFTKIIKLWIPMVIGAASYGLMFLVNNFIASFLKTGSISSLSYAFRLLQLPLGIFGVSIFTVSLPRASLENAEKDNEKVKITLIKSLHLLSVLLLPSAFFLLTDAFSIVRLIYQHGAFGENATIITAQILQLYAIGLFTIGANKVITGIYYSFKESKLPMISSLITVCFNIILALLLIKPLQVKSLALALALGSFVNFAILTRMFSKKFFSFPLSDFLKKSTPSLFASLITSGIFILYKRYFVLLNNNTKWHQLINMTADIIVFSVIYLILVAIFDKYVHEQIKRILKWKKT